MGSRLAFIHRHDSRADTPRLYDQEGNCRGKLSANPYDNDSTSNTYGRYGSNKLMIFNDKRGNLRNIERFESLAFCHS